MPAAECHSRITHEMHFGILVKFGILPCSPLAAAKFLG